MTLKAFMSAMVLAIGSLALSAQNTVLQVTTDKPEGIYRNGENVVFNIQVLENGKPAPGEKFSYELRADGQEPVKNSAVSAAEPIQVKSALNKPGWTHIAVSLTDKDGKPIAKSVKRLGAMIDPESIKPGADEPKDFDAFWKEQRETLNKVPVKAILDDAGVIEKDGVKFRCYDVKIDCAGVAPVSGYLTIPEGAKPGSLKAVVYYHGAGVRSSNKQMNPNAIILDVNAHGILNGQPSEFYQYLNRTNLSGYQFRNMDDRYKFYFREMFLRVMRALDYMKTRPEWNGKDLIAYGSSQGGAQSLAAAALDPQVTLCVACVPALSDHGGILAGRESGWPRLIRLNKDGKPANAKIAETSGYYDSVNFAKRIKAETCVSAGFIDTVCVPTSVYAVYNSLPAGTAKIMYNMPAKGHVADNPPGQKRLQEVLSAK